MPEEGLLTIELLNQQINECVVCRSQGIEISKVTGIQRGNVNASIFCMGLAPSVKAANTGLAFAGVTFSNFYKWFQGAGYQGSKDDLRNSLYLTSILKCYPAKDIESNRRKMWNFCQRHLFSQMEFVKPKVVLLLGVEAAHAFLGNMVESIDIKPGAMFSSTEIYENRLVRDVSFEFTAVCLPHPSGRSRIMNDATTKATVLQSLTACLKMTEISAEGA